MGGGGGTQRVVQEQTPEQIALAQAQLGQAESNAQLQNLAMQMILGINPQTGQSVNTGPAAPINNQGINPPVGNTSKYVLGNQGPRSAPVAAPTASTSRPSLSTSGSSRGSVSNTLGKFLGGRAASNSIVGRLLNDKESSGTKAVERTPLPTLNPSMVNVDPVYGGDRVADFNVNQQQGQQAVTDIANSQNQNLGSTIDNIVNFGTQGVLDINNNQYVQNAINAAINPLQERLTQQILPGISSQAQIQGAFGGSRQAFLESQALDDFTENASDISARMALDAYGQGLDTFRSTSAMLPALESSRYMGADRLNQVGGVQQQQAQNELNSIIDTFYESNTADNRALAELVALTSGLNTGTGGIMAGGGQTTSGGGASRLQNVAGGAMTGYALGGLLGGAGAGAGGAAAGASAGSAAGPYGAMLGALFGLMA